MSGWEHKRDHGSRDPIRDYLREQKHLERVRLAWLAVGWMLMVLGAFFVVAGAYLALGWLFTL